MTTLEQFGKGLRLDQYIASLTQNKENFRANFIKASEIFNADDLAFFRNLPTRINIAVVTEDANLDALRDVPIIGRLSTEVSKMTLRLFRPSVQADVARSIMGEVLAAAEHSGSSSDAVLPVIAFYTPEMQLIGAHICRVPDLSAEMNRRRLAWIASHREIRDAGEPLDKMSPLTRTRLIQAIHALTPEQRLAWGRVTVQSWRRILDAPVGKGVQTA